MRFKDLEVKHLVGEMDQESVWSVQSGESWWEAATTMTERNISAVAILDKEERIKGLITERDLVRKVLMPHFDDTAKSNAQEKSVDDIMTSVDSLVTVDLSTNISDARKIMRNNNVRHLPVVDKNGKLLNMLSGRDIRDAPDTLQGMIVEQLSKEHVLEQQKDLLETHRT